MPIRHPQLNASRLLAAIGRIGYHPASALLDIADNSVSARATKVAITVQTQVGPGRARPSVTAFIIADNGCGMDLAGLDNALSLGSSPQAYHPYTLSKFGLGLKSASASLGQRLEIISRPETDLRTVHKAVLDLSRLRDEYFYELDVPSAEDIQLLSKVAADGAGTVVRITKLHTQSLPSAPEIIMRLRERAGVIYYYFLRGEVSDAPRLEMTIDDEAVEPFDPLAEHEIDTTDGDLDEHNWDGLSPKWLTRPQRVQLDLEGNLFGTVMITQLPHPPSVEMAGAASRAACRVRYRIAAGNYGFYVYRNHRLISWADPFDDFVPRDQDLYAFRGRFLIDSAADDVLNIDVTKSRIRLSEIARDQLRGPLREAVKKSKAAWQTAKARVRALSHDNPHEKANEALDHVSEMEDRSDQLDESAAPQAEQEQRRRRRVKAQAAKPATPEESQKLREQRQRVQWVDTLDNNQLWERAHDPEAGLIVRVNSAHRFARDLLGAVSDNADLIKVIDVFLYALARGEYDVVYKGEHDEEVAESVMAYYRERVGAVLSDVVRTLDVTRFLESPGE